MAKNRLPIDVSDLQLTLQEIKFIGEYCTSNFEEVKAYKRVFKSRLEGLSEPEIRLSAFEVLNKRDVKIAVQRFVDSVLGPAADKLDYQLLHVLRKRAFYDVADFFNKDGTVKRLDQISEEDRVVIDGIEQDLKGKNADAVLTKFKLGDRNAAIKQLVDLLKKKDDAIEEATVATDSQRKMVQEIFNSIQLEPTSTKGIMHDHSNVIVPSMPLDDEEIDEQESVPIELEPALVTKAKEIVKKRSFGFDDDIEDHPLVQQAKEIAKQKEMARGNS